MISADPGCKGVTRGRRYLGITGQLLPLGRLEKGSRQVVQDAAEQQTPATLQDGQFYFRRTSQSWRSEPSSFGPDQQGGRQAQAIDERKQQDGCVPEKSAPEETADKESGYDPRCAQKQQ